MREVFKWRIHGRLWATMAGVERLARSGQQIAAIPMKRAPSAETHYLEREEVTTLFRGLPKTGRHAARDRTLLLFLYNTGARAQEAAGLKWNQLHLEGQSYVRLHGKGDKWR